MNISSKAVYTALALIYAASLLGLPKPVVTTATVAAYMVLAVAKKH